MKLMKNCFFLLSMLMISQGSVLSQGLIVVPGNEKHGTPWNVGNIISKFNASNDSFVEIYRDSQLDFWEENIKVSPNGRLIGAVGMMKGHYLDKNFASYTRFSLVLFDSTGKLQKRIVDVPLFDWSPSGDSIVYVTGKTYSDKEYPSTDRLWLLDLQTGKTVDLGTTMHYTRGIVWTKFDGQIYVHEGGVYRINPTTKVKQLTGYRDINFSPDGKYYFVTNPEPQYFRIYERETNKDVTPAFIHGMFVTNFSKWLSDSKGLVIGDVSFEKKIYDVETKTIRTTFQGNILGYNPQTNEIYVHKDKRYFKGIPASKVYKIEAK